MKRKIINRLLKSAAAATLAALGAGAAGAAAPFPYDTAAAAAAVADEYELIAATPCVDGAAQLPYDNYVEYEGDVIYEVVATRCAQCREDRLFYFDLTPRYGKLAEFREAKLATRAVVPAGDFPCPSAAGAVTVASITEEYIFVETTRHTCGTPLEAGGQSLVNEGGHYYDVLDARCPADGAQAEFYFNVDALIGNPEAYPELEHARHAVEVPAALPGRTLETAFRGDADARRAFVANATHAADGAPLEVIGSWTYRGREGDVAVFETACAECGTPVRLFVHLGD
jgi:hypothetical protein